jgi:CBS domain-containing protein
MLDLEHIRVHDAMHPGILSCLAGSPLREVAEIMATHHVHAVVINRGEGARPVGVVSDLDIVTAIIDGRELSAGQVAATEPLTVSSDERLNRAAQLMAAHGVSHLVVADAADGHPIGVLSTLDLAAVYADGTTPEDSAAHGRRTRRRAESACSRT